MTKTIQNGLESGLLEVQTKRLRLRAPNEGDADDLTRLLDDWNVAKWLARVPHPYQLADAYAFIEYSRAKEPSEYDRNFIVVLGSELIGCVGLTGETAGVLELGYWIAREHWGCGYATEAAAGLIEYAETRLGCTRLEANYQKDNLGSARVLRKLGFRVCGKKNIFSLAHNRDVSSTCMFLDLKY